MWATTRKRYIFIFAYKIVILRLYKIIHMTRDYLKLFLFPQIENLAFNV